MIAVVIQQLSQLRASLGERAHTEAGNFIPMIVDKRILKTPNVKTFCVNLAKESNFVVIPYGNGNDAMVFDKEQYKLCRAGTCIDSEISITYESISDGDLTWMDEAL